MGTIGDIGSFSFSAPKIISTGQGGAIVTNNKKSYEQILKLKDFGRTQGGTDLHDQIGFNFNRNGSTYNTIIGAFCSLILKICLLFRNYSF